jgi:hypothetical protein
MLFGILCFKHISGINTGGSSVFKHTSGIDNAVIILYFKSTSAIDKPGGNTVF